MIVFYNQFLLYQSSKLKAPALFISRFSLWGQEKTHFKTRRGTFLVIRTSAPLSVGYHISTRHCVCKHSIFTLNTDLYDSCVINCLQCLEGVLSEKRLCCEQVWAGAKHFEARMSEAKDLLSISDFYAQKTVFITGATGFLGKVVIEKLLRACPHVKKIYLLARSRRGVSPQQRIDDLLDGMVGFSYDSSFFYYISDVINFKVDSHKRFSSELSSKVKCW